MKARELIAQAKRALEGDPMHVELKSTPSGTALFTASCTCGFPVHTTSRRTAEQALADHQAFTTAQAAAEGAAHVHGPMRAN